MWHVKAEVAPAILLVVDFGGWYKLDSKAFNESSSGVIHHTQVSLLKDVIVPYTHLLPCLPLSENQKLEKPFFTSKELNIGIGPGGLVREKLWDLLINEPRGTHQRRAGTDAIQSLCIPVIVSDNIELPFEGMVDYSEFSVFVAVSDALQPSWLVNHLRSYSSKQKDRFRHNMALVQPIFEYENGQPGEY
ncbi:hypothetical protein HAX54_030483 [Datura stramonium]|uniref:Exostosin GT47 domain-containing protein n=1 Tax=Datura stramonium TaxID=4076 RepID=A0ABS8VAM8_DATST|nr:hypothetical protein [Datura stramonium]